MTRPGLVALSLLFISCGHRAPPVIDGSTHADGVSTDKARPGDLAAFCSGASKASINGSTLMVEQVTGQDYISAAHTEGARVQLIAAGAGERWEINAEVMVRLGQTITDKPLPRTIEIGPPAGLDSSIFFRKPPGCSSDPACQSDLLATEYHKLWGWATLDGADYRGPLKLELCLSGSDNGGVHPGKLQVHTVQLYAPSVTIPRWQLL